MVPEVRAAVLTVVDRLDGGDGDRPGRGHPEKQPPLDGREVAGGGQLAIRVVARLGEVGPKPLAAPVLAGTEGIRRLHSAAIPFAHGLESLDLGHAASLVGSVKSSERGPWLWRDVGKRLSAQRRYV